MEKFEKIIKSHQWWIGEAPAYLATTMPFVRAFVLTPKYFRVGYTKVCLIMKRDYAWQLLDKEEGFKVSESLINDYIANPKSIKAKITQWQEILGQFLKFCNEIDKRNLDNLPNEELIKLCKKYFDQFVNIWTIPLILESNGPYSNEIISPKFMAETGLEKKRAYEAFATLTTSEETSFAAAERLSLLKIIDFSYEYQGKINQKTALKLWQELEKHAANFYYVHNNYQKVQRLRTTDFVKEVELERKSKPRKKIQEEIATLKNTKRRLISEKAKLVKNLKLSGKMRAILEALALFGWWQDERKKMTLIGNWYVMLFVKKIAKRLKISYQEIAYALPEELIGLKSKTSLARLLKARRVCLLVYETADDVEEIFVGKKAQRLMDLLMPFRKQEEFKLEGIVASRGAEPVVQGRTRIVLNPHEDPFEEGEILVASMTRPEFVTLMRKAKGIITNEGGVTSHAAIIAREFGIPCIVGTREATHVLANGDLVEMRMNHGVVLKL